MPTAVEAADAQRELPEDREGNEANESTVIEDAETGGNASFGIGSRNESRHRLLSALKPYVSKDRSRALDSMEAIANILEMLRS